ncbi:sulfite exporter TauE/SafE family protein [Peredibacter sp. HCB2-198]|uniref:sulfite exporter TauE/SafE family protein n=1 Tax=Peredibacter sp. HCB2-198 TaxID=3383025 RepID=UPI0038B5FFCE
MVSTELIFLCLAAFGAGFVDSIVGGGGMIQLPALLSILPQYPVVTLLGTNKLVSVTGTAVSAYRFSRQIPYIKTVIVPAILSAFIFSFFGAWVVSIVSSAVLKPLFMVLLFLVFIFTIRNKSFGTVDHDPNVVIPMWKPLVIGSVMGFYDGFFGPGTGTFLIIAFVGMLGMTFVQGSAYAKIINLTTNIAAILLFTMKGKFLFSYAIPMMLFNVGGAMLGVKLALLKGNTFVRGLLRGVVLMTILKLGYDVFKDFALS